jgi:hypothetical protein
MPGQCRSDLPENQGEPINLTLSRRRELIDEIELEPADPAVYDRFCNITDEGSHGTT